MLVNKFKRCTEDLLKAGCFADLTCKATIEGTCDLGNRTNIWTEVTEYRVEGYLENSTWEEGLFSTSVENSLSLQLMKNAQTLNLLGL